MLILDHLIAFYMARQILAVHATKKVDTSVPPEKPKLFDDAFWYKGVGGTELTAWVMKPKLWTVRVVEDEPQEPVDKHDWHCYQATSRADGSQPWVVIEGDSSRDRKLDCRGTLLLIHGWRDSVLERPYLRGLAALLAGEGYRIVMPDLRGHGQSRGKYLGYGLLEGRDMVALLDELETRYSDGRPFGIIGHSYGGNVALMTTALDRRIRAAVIASAPDHLRGILTSSVKRYYPMMEWLVSSRVTDMAMRKAIKRTGLDYFSSSAMDAIRSTDAPVLLIHGGKDATIPYSCSERIMKARPENTELLSFPDESHAGLFGSELKAVHRRCAEFFNPYM